MNHVFLNYLQFLSNSELCSAVSDPKSADENFINYYEELEFVLV